jgi:hypothetical protein
MTVECAVTQRRTTTVRPLSDGFVDLVTKLVKAPLMMTDHARSGDCARDFRPTRTLSQTHPWPASVCARARGVL